MRLGLIAATSVAEATEVIGPQQTLNVPPRVGDGVGSR
jgi:hypothetical protein